MQSLPSRAPFPPTGSGNCQIRAKSQLGRATGAGTWVKPLGTAEVARDRPLAGDAGGLEGAALAKPTVPVAPCPAAPGSILLWAPRAVPPGNKEVVGPQWPHRAAGKGLPVPWCCQSGVRYSLVCATI